MLYYSFIFPFLCSFYVKCMFFEGSISYPSVSVTQPAWKLYLYFSQLHLSLYNVVMLWLFNFPSFNVFMRCTWTKRPLTSICLAAWQHKKRWLEPVTWDFVKMLVWFRGKSQKSNKSGQKQREALSALSVILDALGLVCSCHGNFGWTFVLMRTNGLHHFLPEHPPPLPMHACTHTRISLCS